MFITEAQIIIDDESLETENSDGEIIVEHPSEEVGELAIPNNSHHIEVQDPGQGVVELVVEIPDFGSIIPGVDPNEAEVLSVSENSDEDEPEDEKKDEDEAKDKKLNPKWNWKERGASGFIAWLKERFDSVPKHSGKDTAGIERAISYLNKLDKEISNAMRQDLDEELNFQDIESVRSKIENGIERLEARLSELNKSKKKRKKKADLEDGEIIKEAKVNNLHGNYVQVPLLISALARMCINGTVSAGHSMEDNLKKVGEKFKLSSREKFELAFLIQDMGFPVKADRYFIDVMDKPRDKTEDGLDYMANYNA